MLFYDSVIQQCTVKVAYYHGQYFFHSHMKFSLCNSISIVKAFQFFFQSKIMRCLQTFT